MQKSVHSRISAVVFFVMTALHPGAQQASLKDAAPLQKMLSELSFQEKAAQVLMVNIKGNKTASKKSVAAFKGLVPGAVILFGYNIGDTPQGTAAFLSSVMQCFKDAAEEAGTSFIPPLYALDNEGGTVYRTRRLTASLPAAEEIGQRFSVAETSELYRLLGLQMRELGIHLNLAPVAEVLTEENRAVLGTRTYGKAPDQVAEYAAAAVRGMQEAGILAAVKHFPGNGAADPHKSSAVLPVDYETLLKNYCAVFQPSIAAETAAVLVSHITVPAVEAVPFCFSVKGIALLRKELGFSGLIITDDIAMQALRQGGASFAGNAVRALAAGCDMVMCSLQDVYPLIAAIAEKAASDAAFAKRLDEAVERVLTAKQKAGLINADIPIDTDEFFIRHTPDWERFRQTKENADTYERIRR